MKSYFIRINSLKTYSIVLIPLVILNMILLDQAEINSRFISFIVTMLLLYLSLRIAEKLSSAEVEIKLSKEGFEHKWIKNFLFSNDKDEFFKWDEIGVYSFRTYMRGTDYFQLNLGNGLAYRIYKLQFPSIKDDFSDFELEFSTYYSEYTAWWNRSDA